MMGGGKNNDEDIVLCSYESKKHLSAISPDKPKGSTRHLSNIGINFRSVPPI